MIIPDNKAMTFWLFADNLGPTGNLFEFVDFLPNYKTESGKEIPVFLFVGEDSKYSGEFVCSIWNIRNLKDIKKILGEDSVHWVGKKFVATKATAEGNGVKLTPQ